MNNEQIDIIYIENWCLVGDPWLPPEAGILYLKGNVCGHPRIDDGKCVSTSNIIKVENGFVETQSGSVYKLGTIDPDYKKWCAENNFNLNRFLVEENNESSD